MADITRELLARALDAAVGGVWTVVDEDSGREYTGKLRYPENLANAVLVYLTDHRDESGSRWPMSRADLLSRLTLALDGCQILASRDPAPGGSRHYVRAWNPDGLAAELVIAIDMQPDDDWVASAHRVAHRNEPAGPACPDEPEYRDITAAAKIIRELNDLSGTSGAGLDQALNVLRFVAGRYGYQVTEQE